MLISDVGSVSDVEDKSSAFPEQQLPLSSHGASLACFISPHLLCLPLFSPCAHVVAVLDYAQMIWEVLRLAESSIKAVAPPHAGRCAARLTHISPAGKCFQLASNRDMML